MRYLWLTLADPDPPHNGQYVYSGGLIHSVADAGVEVTVLGLQRPEAIRVDGEQEGRISWQLAPHRPLSQWNSLLSTLPNVANRCRTVDMGRKLRQLLEEESWDAIIFDGISAGWALASVRARYRHATRAPKLVYVSHNHEMSLRAQIAGRQSAIHRRLAMWLDARKVRRLENQLVAACDLTSAITPEDCRRYRSEWPEKPIEILTPGFTGRTMARRHLTDRLPRRAILVGSFDWIAKRLNLEEFISVADPIFAANGVELHVVGSGEPSFLDRMRRRVVSTRFVGQVQSVDDHIKQARVAVVPERAGGGFKLKVLDYVFGRTPVFALNGSVAGMPLHDCESIRLYPDQEALALGVVEAIDDLDRLNRQQDRAFDACRDQFDWRSRGHQLVSAVGAL